MNAITYNKCLNNSSLEPGESKDGELLFEIPDEMAQSGEALYIKLEPKKTGTFLFVIQWNKRVPRPAQKSVIEVFSRFFLRLLWDIWFVSRWALLI